MSNSDASVQLVLADNNTPGTGAPPTFRLDLVAQKGLKSGQSLDLQVLEASILGGEAKEIDRFSVRVVQQGANWVFRDVVDLRPETHPARAGKHCLTAHFQLMFTGIEGAQVCILPVPDIGIPMPAYVSVKAIAKDKPLDSACTPQRILRHSLAGLVTQCLDVGGRVAAGALAGSMWNQAASDAIVGKDARERMSLERQVKAQEEAQEQYQEFLKMQDTPLKVQGVRLQEYHKNLAKIMEIRRDWESRGGVKTSPPPPILRDLVKANQRIEEELEQFLNISVGIPESYRIRAQQGAERREFVDKMAELENSLGFKLVCCLPLGGLAEGFVQILQGKYAEGFLSIGLEVVTYGSFKALGVLRHNFDAFQAANQSMRRAVFEARYLHVLAEGKEIRMTMFKGLGEIAGAKVSFLGPLFSLGTESVQLMDQIRDIGILVRRKEAIREALSVAQNQNYKNWLNELARTNKKLVWFGAIRSAAFAFKVGDAGVDLASETKQAAEARLRALSPKDLKEKVARGFETLTELLPDGEREWWLTGLVGGIRNMSESFFDPSNGFLAEWQKDRLEWEAEIRRLKREEGTGRKGPRLFKSRDELLTDLETLMGYWRARDGQYQRIFKSHGFTEVTEWHYANYQPLGVYLDNRLDVGMKSFLAQIGDAQCLLEADTNLNSRRLRDLVILGAIGNSDPDKVIYVKSNFEKRAKEFINLLHGAY